MSATNGQDADATFFNGLLKLYGAGSSLVGGAAPAADLTAGYKFQAGTINATTSSTGRISIALPTPFPGGVLAAFAQTAGVGHNSVDVDQGSCTDSVLSVVVFDTTTGTGLNAVTLPITWLAIGW